MIGVSDPNFLETIAGALARLGAAKALVVSSADGLDEMSTSGTTRVVEVDGEQVRAYDVAPRTWGLRAPEPAALTGRHAGRQRATTRRIFAGEPGPARDVAVLNAGAAIYVSGTVDDLGSRRPRRRGRDRRRPRDARRAGDLAPDASRRSRRAAGRSRSSTGSSTTPATRSSASASRRRWPSSSRMIERRAEGPPVQRGAHAPGRVADRRAQAALAVRGPDPRGRTVAEVVRAYVARRRAPR